MYAFRALANELMCSSLDSNTVTFIQSKKVLKPEQSEAFIYQLRTRVIKYWLSSGYLGKRLGTALFLSVYSFYIGLVVKCLCHLS